MQECPLFTACFHPLPKPARANYGECYGQTSFPSAAPVILRAITLLALALGVSACGAALPPPATASITAPPLRVTGLERVLGHDARNLVSLFGPADQDVWEASARKLQFGSGICILDAYLYPPSKGKEPLVTYVEARQNDGTSIDKASCVAALTRRREAR